MQALLLRFLENGEIQSVGADTAPRPRRRARVVAATNRNLAERVAAGEFREDLLYRLRVIHIHVPPLRERREDIAAAGRAPAREVAARRSTIQRRGAAAAASAIAGPATSASCRTSSSRPSGSPNGDRDRRRRTCRAACAGGRATRCCRPASAGARSPTSSTTRWCRAATRSGSTFTRCSWRATSRGTTCASWCVRGLRTTRGNYRALLRLFGMPHARLQAVPQLPDAHDCKVDYRAFRTGVSDAPPPTRAARVVLPEAPAPARRSPGRSVLP